MAKEKKAAKVVDWEKRVQKSMAVVGLCVIFNALFCYGEGKNKVPDDLKMCVLAIQIASTIRMIHATIQKNRKRKAEYRQTHE